MSLDLRPRFSSFQRAMGLDATVTVPDGDPVEAVVVWQPPQTGHQPLGEGHRRSEATHVLAIPADVVPEVPRGTVVAVPLSKGGAVINWKVDEVTRDDPDHHRALMVPA